MNIEPGRTAPDDALVKSIRRSALVLAIVAVFTVIYFARALVLPIMLGFLIALTLSPINRAMMRRSVPSGLSATLLIACTTAVVVGVGTFAGGTLATWFEEAPRIGQQLEIKLRGVTDAVATVQEVSEQVENIGSNKDSTAPGDQEVVVDRPGLFTTAITGFASTATTIGVALVLAFFLLASGQLFYAKLVESFTSLQEKKRALSVVYAVENHVSRYLLAITMINAGLGLCIGTALHLIGLENAYIWGVAAFLLNYLPFIGGLIGTALVGAYAIMAFDSLGYALLAPLAYQTLTTLEGQFVTPALVGRSLEMNAVAVFLTLVVWTWLWGVPGALVAVPILVVFKAICDKFDHLQPIGNFLGR
ncbi:MAG: AI-2E family transporter [Pseudomonadota bacterium]